MQSSIESSIESSLNLKKEEIIKIKILIISSITTCISNLSSIYLKEIILLHAHLDHYLYSSKTTIDDQFKSLMYNDDSSHSNKYNMKS